MQDGRKQRPPEKRFLREPGGKHWGASISKQTSVCSGSENKYINKGGFTSKFANRLPWQAERLCPPQKWCQCQQDPYD